MTDHPAMLPMDRQNSYLALVRQRRLYGSLLTVLFVVALVAGFRVADERNAGGFWDGLPHILDFPADVVTEAWQRADELPGLLWQYLPSLVETLNIAAVSTLTGACAAFFLALLATRGLARWPRLVGVFRRLLDVLRAIPDIVIALVLIFLMGGGPVPAMIAIALHTAGALGKQFSEVNENADLKPLEGLASTGAVWGQRMWLGVVPQVAPNYLSYTLLRFEINIRASAILGFVGAGGLGYELRNAISWGMGRFAESAAIFLLLFGTIVLFDQLSSQWRDRLIRERSRA